MTRNTAVQTLSGLIVILAFGLAAVQIRQGLQAQNIVLDWGIFRQPSSLTQGTYATTILLGLLTTIKLAALGLGLALTLGTAVGLGRLSVNPVVSRLCAAYVGLFRNTPLLVQFFFWNFAAIPLLPAGPREWLYAHKPEQWATVAALGVYTAAFVAETVRAGIQGLPAGQTEAARSLGMPEHLITRRIILPQAFRSVLPPLGSQALNLTKNSSLASQIGVTELFFQGSQIQATTFRGFESIAAIALGYLVLSAVITAGVRLLERRFAQGAVR
ncbi:amino acid ABC transporter permease [Deinococcus sp. A31D244]|uniref:Amino acid ABC transporter permease n=1 Tax=Deinococcus aquaticus TaxID=328692 RepID=A0ABY7V7E6_9DEIO|nr:amino acid ABC transporter permease [Deinococcus aquaticus]WDA60816.1 amino acid ABC transporter permease [Deinococcus aquaticus]